MEVYDVAKMGRPKSANPKNTLIGLKLTEEEATKLREYASKHDMTVTEVLQKELICSMQWKIPKEAKCENSFLEKGEKWHIQGRIEKGGY
ncbi:MAG: hypothetical protein ACLRWM_00540 [Streptococcus sp.]